MKYKVLIPAAGIGSRLGEITKYINKALVSIGTKPALARIIDMFPEDTEIVIPVGYKGNLIREFVTLAYPERKIEIIDINPYEGEGSGLGLTVLCCEKLLQEPFIFCSCDTLVLEKIPEPDHNWMGYGEKEELNQYRTLLIQNGNVTKILEKNENGTGRKPYIGIAGIYDYNEFWNAMKNGHDMAVQQGESFGLKKILETKQINACPFTWMDTGIPEELENTKKHFHKENDPNILEKANEAIWFMDDRVIKYSNDTKFIHDRVKRASQLDGYIPHITEKTEHMYAYTYEYGDVLSKVITLPKFIKLLDYSKSFWKSKNLNQEEQAQFDKDCMTFYKDKTYDRVSLFYRKFQKKDGTEPINDRPMPTLKSLLDALDWNMVAKGIPVRFHGDFHFENILYDSNKDKFIFLDWRQNFGKSIEIGDIYYDFGKLVHGLIVCHELIAKDMYTIDWQRDAISFELHRKQTLVECEKYFYEWLQANGYDVTKVKIMTALIYLNIAPLHHYPYSLMLYALGKQMLCELT